MDVGDHDGGDHDDDCDVDELDQFGLAVSRTEKGRMLVLTEIEEPVRAGGQGVGFLTGFDGVDFGGVELFFYG